MKSRVSLSARLRLGPLAALVTVAWGLLLRLAAAQPAPDAPAPLIEIYGTLLPFLEYSRSTGATAASSLVPDTTGASQVAAMAYSGVNQPARFRMDSGTSNLGFRGGVELSPYLSVVWQVESGVQLDGAPVANTIASRNSQLGVTGPWGTLFFGQWDTPYKWSTVTSVNPIRGGFLPDYNSVVNTPGFGVASVTTQFSRANGAPDAAFDRRQGNTVQYWTPTISGLSARLAYSANEGRTASTTTMMGTTPSIQPSLFGASLSFDRGPIKLRDAFELHHDYFGMSQLGGSAAATSSNTSSTDWGNKIMAMYTSPLPGFETRVVGVFDYLSYKNKDSNAGAIDEYARATIYGLVEQTLLGKHHVWVGFGKGFKGSCSRVGGAACSTTGLGVIDTAVGYLYRASKSTDFFAVAYRIGNDESATYSTSPALGGATAPGVAVQAFGVGMLYTFSATLAGKAPAAPPPPPPPPPVAVPVETQSPGSEPTPANPPADPGQAPPPARAPSPQPSPQP